MRVVFYPGRYDGQSLRLFGKLKNNNYYRAFKLEHVPPELNWQDSTAFWIGNFYRH